MNNYLEDTFCSHQESFYAFSPLDIPDILQFIFKNLSVWNLKKTRLVCKYWAAEATTILRKRSKITFRTEEALQEYCKLDLTHISECFDIKSEVKLKNPKSQSFFAKYGHICKSLDISFHHDYNSTVIAEILPCLANNLQEICLNGRANFLYEESSRDFLINAFPKLKCLFIYDSSFDLNGLEPRRIWAENVFHILAGSPSLEKIFYAPFLETRAKMFFEILNNLPIQHSNLSHLHINHLWTNAQETHSLLSKQYPLKYAHLVLTSHLPKVSLNQLLNSLKNTLRELTLTFTDGTSCLEFHPICPLEKITKLSLIGYDGPLLVSDAPVLKLFVMSLPDCNINAGNIMVNPDLEELEIYDFQAKYNPNYLKTLFRKFSKLKSLKINNVNNEILWAIYAYLPELEELKTCFHKFYGVATSRIDTGLNGLAGSQLDEELLDMWDDRGISHLRVNPWIGQLANLKHLTLEVGLMSDFGLILGISRCKNLIVLTLKNIGGNFENTNDSRIILTDRSLKVMSEEMDLYYLKLDGFSHMFSVGAIEKAKYFMESREFIIVN